MLLHVLSVWLTFVSGFFEILQELQSGREIANGHRDDNLICPLRAYNKDLKKNYAHTHVYHTNSAIN